MKAKVKNTGRIVSGKVAELFVKIGIAEEVLGTEIPDAWAEPEPVKNKPGRKPGAKGKK